jgi:ParB/Sulfiredoxin domain
MKLLKVDARVIRRPHFACDECGWTQKVGASMQKHGWKGRPILAFYSTMGALQAITGSHRITAARLTGTPVPVRLTELEGSYRETASTNPCVLYWNSGQGLDTKAYRLLKKDERSGDGSGQRDDHESCDAHTDCEHESCAIANECRGGAHGGVEST